MVHKYLGHEQFLTLIIAHFENYSPGRHTGYSLLSSQIVQQLTAGIQSVATVD